MGHTPFVGSAVASHGLDGTYETSLKSWLRKVGEVPLLTPEAERDLARLTTEGSKEAGKELVERNLRLVIRVAKQFSGYGVPICDLIQEGNVGLLRAASKYDYRLGFRFSTYAIWWVKQSVRRAISYQASSVRIPAKAHCLVAKGQHIASRMKQLNGREPSQIEISEALGVPLSQWIAACGMSSRVLSLDVPLNGQDGPFFSDVLEDNLSQTPFEYARNSSLHDKVTELLTCLNIREREVIELRYGLFDGESWSLEAIAKATGVTRERVRQIQEQALAKMRRAPCMIDLQGIV